MGNDAALACLSDFSPLLFSYFQQLFAQVRIVEQVIAARETTLLRDHFSFADIHMMLCSNQANDARRGVITVVIENHSQK